MNSSPNASNSNDSYASGIGAFLKGLFSPAGWKAAAIGGAGALAGFVASSILLEPFFDFSLASRPGFLELLFGQALMFGINGAVLSAAILAWDNHASLRGRWHRNLLPGALLFLLLAFMSGGIGQLLYSIVGLTRSFPWLLAGAGIGAGIGLLRRDNSQALRGALGGAIGGLFGGLLVDGFLALSYSDEAFMLGSFLGTVVTGAMIALFMRAVQQAMQSAWLMGISSGPYEGKEYPLNTARITIGQTELNDIALYRDRTVPARAGAFVFENSGWRWISDSPDASVLINNRMTTDAVLQPGSQIQIGDTRFTFQARSLRGQSAAGQPNAGQPTATHSTPLPPTGSTPPHVTGNFPLSPPVVMGWQLQHPQTPLQIGADGAWTVGRGSENDLVVGDGTISSRHARLEARAGVLAIADVGSTNGTFINGVRLVPNVPAALRSGDRLQLGQSEFSIRQIEQS